MYLVFAIALAVTQAAAAPVGETGATERDQERLICRSRPVAGSRIAQQRVCKTAAEWRIYQNDLEQARRDHGDQGRNPLARNPGMFPCTPTQPCN